MPMLSLRDIEKVEGILNEIFMLVITATISDFDVSRIVIGNGSSRGVMYLEFFKKISLNIEKLWPYKASNVKVLNNIIASEGTSR